MSVRKALPSLRYDFRHATITDATLGPRRELRLAMRVLIFRGTAGHLGDGLTVRFGGIRNYDEVAAFFADHAHRQAEIARLDYDPARPSRPADLHFVIEYERIASRIAIQCLTFSVKDDDPGEA